MVGEAWGASPAQKGVIIHCNKLKLTHRKTEVRRKEAKGY